MGREIYCQIRKDGQDRTNPIWDSAADIDWFVCGRDDATGYVSMYAGKEAEICLSDESALKRVLEEIRVYAKRDFEEIDKAKTYLGDLKAARGNALNFKDFASFNEEIERTEDWLKNETYSRADSLIRLIEASMREKKRHPIKYRKAKLYLVVDE